MKTINSVPIELTVVLGRATLPIHQLLRMGRGAVIELDRGERCGPDHRQRSAHRGRRGRSAGRAHRRNGDDEAEKAAYQTLKHGRGGQTCASAGGLLMHPGASAKIGAGPL